MASDSGANPGRTLDGRRPRPAPATPPATPPATSHFGTFTRLSSSADNPGKPPGQTFRHRTQGAGYLVRRESCPIPTIGIPRASGRFGARVAEATTGKYRQGAPSPTAVRASVVQEQSGILRNYRRLYCRQRYNHSLGRRGRPTAFAKGSDTVTGGRYGRKTASPIGRVECEVRGGGFRETRPPRTNRWRLAYFCLQGRGDWQGWVGRRHVLPRPGPHVGRWNPGGQRGLTHRGRGKASHI